MGGDSWNGRLGNVVWDGRLERVFYFFGDINDEIELAGDFFSWFGIEIDIWMAY